MDAYERLAIGIVTQAAEDYRRAQLRFRRAKPDSDDQLHAIGDIRVLERFFRSEWGNALAFGKGEIILEELKKECGKYG